MTRYTLKDKELIKKYEAIWPDFAERLDKRAQTEKGFTAGVTLETGNARLFFDWDEIEVYAEYDPTRWNYVTKTVPPENVVMLTEYVFNERKYGRSCVCRGGEWFTCDTSGGDILPMGKASRICRFRPYPKDDDE